MVLEGYLSRFLVERFGRYVKGLDAENLRLSAWKGEILLRGLQLVPEALSEGLDIPVEVKWGHVGLFQLSVPWNKLGSKPVCATLEDVYILVAPLDTWSMDDMERQRRARYQKSRGVEWRLRKHLERKASLAQGVSKDEGGGKGRWGRLLAKILDNVQITVKNIHIRYEDELSLDDGTGTVPRPLSAGITLRQLVVQTVDEHWTPTYVQEAGGGKGGESGGRFVYKLVSVDSLAVYCDEEVSPPPRPRGHHTASSSAAVAATDSHAAEVPPRSGSALQSSSSPSLPQPGNDEEIGGEVPPASGGGSGAAGRDRSFLAPGLTDEDLESMFRTSLAGGGDRHSYVVIPASPVFRLRVQRDGGGDGGGSSKYKIQAFFNEVGLVLNNSQIANINKMRSTLRDLERWEALYRHRPKHKIKDGPKAWWVYLVKCVSRPGKAEKRAKLGWPDVVRLLSLRKLYVRLYTARARHQATPEEYQQFTRLDEQLTANEIVAFRVKAIAELEEQEEQEASLLSSSSSANLAVTAAGEPAVPRQTWGQWLLRRDPVPAAAAAAGGGDGATTAEEIGPAAGAATQREDAAAQAEFLRAFSSPEGDAEGDNGGGDEHKNRVLFDVEASLNEGALTLVNAGQPCLRIIFDLKADLQKQKTDWRLELGLGALQAFGLAGQGARATTLLTRRTWKPPKADAGGDAGMIQIGDFQVWKSGGIIVEYQREEPDNATANKGGGRSSSSSTPAGPARKALASPLVSPRGVSSSGGDGGGVSAEQAGSAGRWGGGGGGVVVTVKVVFAPHQLMHSRACVDQVTSMLATRDMRLLASAAQSKISRLKRATRSSFLHALGSSKRVEVTADIHAPLVVLPEDLEECSRSSLLVLDLGHIAFRRDDALKRDAVENPPGDSPRASPPGIDVGVAPSSVEGVPAPGLSMADPLVADAPDDIAQDDWLLDVTGVQVVVADSSSFLGAASSDNGPNAQKAALANDTAIVEEFDLNVKVRTATDLSTNGLIGVRVEANLPRLSCNVHSSAYLLLTRLLKNELERPTTAAAAADPIPRETHLVSSGSEGEQTTRVPQTGARGAVASRLFPASATPSLSSGSPGGKQRDEVPVGPTLGRHRLIKAVLASELEPVTEVPGEGLPEDSDDSVAGAGVGRAGVFSRTPRKNSLSSGHHRRRSSSGSGSIHSPIPAEDSGCGGGQGVEGAEKVVGEAGDGGDRHEEGYLEQPQAPAAGLVLEVRVSAPLICVLLVHDDHSTSTSSGSHTSGNGSPGRSATTSSPARPLEGGGSENKNRVGRPPPPKGGAGHAAVSGSGGDGEFSLPGERLAPPSGGASETVAEGALVLLEICGLGVDYRDAVGGGDGRGSGGRGIADADAAKQEEQNPADEPPSKGDPPGGDADGDDDSPCKFCLTASSFRVKDMHQRVTGDAGFSYLLSSQDPSSSSSLPLVLPEEEALRITYHTIPEKSTGDGRSGSRAVVVLGGVWANWNPETVGALSVFTYGMYGNSGGGGTVPEIGDGGGEGGRPNAEQGKVDKGSGRGVPSSRSEGLPSYAGGSSIPEQAGERAERPGAAEPASAKKGRRGGAIIVKVKRVSLWLNKEVHGRRLLLLEARESSAEIFKYQHSEGSVSNYSIALGSASLTDLGTKHSRWRSLVCPSLDATLPPQEVRLDIEQDSRQGIEFPLSVNLVLQSCTVNYLNQTWLETLDYLMNGVLGDGPWCPWLLIPQPEDDHSVHERVLPPPPPALKKKSLRIKALDAEVRLPAGHAGASWVTFDANTLTATNSYETRRMGDVPSAKPETCQVWSVALDGVGIRSSRRYQPVPEEAVAPSPSTVVPPRAGSKLLRDGVVSLEEVTVEAWWPVVPLVGGAESDGVTSNYVVVGRAPGLDLDLHEDDFSVLWQVLAENISGPVPEAAESLFASSGLTVGPWSAQADGSEQGSSTNDTAANSRGEHTSEAVARTGRRRRQLAIFPYEHPSDIATTFDVTFHLPDVALVAHAGRDAVPDSRVFDESRAAPNAADVGGGGQTEAGGVVEVGTVRSALLTWRMLRLWDFRSSNEVVMAEPLLTESTHGKELSASDGGDRKLLSPGQIVPLSLGASAPLVGARVPGATGDTGAAATSAAASFEEPEKADGQRGRATSDKVGDGVAPPQENDNDSASPPGLGAPSPGANSPSCFRWKKRSWPDGGRTNSLAVSGASVLLSRVGWGRWRVWAAAATGGGDDDNDDLSPKDESAKQQRQQVVVAGEETAGIGSLGGTSFGEREAPPNDATSTARTRKVSNSEAQGSSLEPANVAVGIAIADPLGASDAGLIAELASAFDVYLSETCLVLEPWNYDSGCDRSGACGRGGDNGWEGGDSAAVVIRLDMSMRMTSAFFLDGHWAAKLAASGKEAFQPTVPLPTAGDMGRQDDDSFRTTLFSCRLAKVEAFSRPSRGGLYEHKGSSRVHRKHRPAREDNATRSPATGMPRVANPPQGHPKLSDERGPNVRHAKATTAGWRTVMEPAAGTVSYAFSPPRRRPPPSTTSPALAPSKDASATAASTTVDEPPGGVYGRQRVSVEGLSAVRAVVRPSDVQAVARALSSTAAAASPSVGGSVRRGPAHEEASPVPLATTPPRPPSGIVDLSVRASGAGVTVRLEDDSGVHFVPPPPPLPRQQQAEDYAFPSSLQSISSSCSSRRNTYDGEELEEERVLPTPTSRIGSVPCTTTTASGPRVEHSSRFAAGFSRDDKEDMPTTVGGMASGKMSSALLSATCGFPGQPVVEASVGEWDVRYSRVVGCGSGGGGGDASTVIPGREPGRETGLASADDDDCGFAETLTTSATVSVSTVRVIDLLQRVPCHGVYRELLVIPSNRAPSPPRQQQPQQQAGGPFSATVPMAAKPVRTSSEGRPASPTWQEWLEEEEEDKGRQVARSGSPSICGRDKTPHSGQEEPSIPIPAPSGKWPAPVRHQQRSQSPPPPQAPGDEDPAPSVLVRYRKVVSFGNLAEAAAPVTSGSPRCDPLGVCPESPAAAEASSSGERSRVSVAVELGGPVTANWNPRTVVALWGVRSALSWSAAGVGGDPDVDDVTPAEEPDPGGGDRDPGKENHTGQGTGSRRGAGASPTPTCSTEIQVTACRGLEVMFNKEKEGRQLIAVSAASLALTVEALSGGCAAGKSTVVWDGRLDDLTARDPRASNLLYSTLVGRPSPPRPTVQQPASPVALTFRYSKEKGDESGGDPSVAATVPPTALRQASSGETAPTEGRVAVPWESSSLSLSFSELQVVYFQPLWLEVIDFLWEGVLGAAVWGGSAVPEEAAGQGAPAPTGDSTPGAREKEGMAADRGNPGLRSLSQIQVTLSAPTVVLPGSLIDPRHLTLRPKTFRFNTWTGGADDSSAPPRLEQCSPCGPVARHMTVEAGETDIGLGFCCPRGPRPRSPAGAVQSGATGLFYSLLQEHVDVKVAVKTVSPPPPLDSGSVGSDCGGRNPPREVGSSSGGTGVSPAVEVASACGVAKIVEEETLGDEGCNGDSTEEDEGAGSSEEGEQEKTMEVRVELPRLLQVSLTPDARAALAGCVGENVLAAGFHGEVSENFPLVASKEDDDAETSNFGSAGAAGVEQEVDEIDPEREVRGTTKGGGEKRHHEGGGTEPRVDRAGGGVGGYPLPFSPRAVRKHQQRHPSPPQSSSGTAVGSRGGDGVSPPLVCPLCTDSFDELLARHECAWCGGTVCRKCMHTQVLIYDDDGTSNAPGESDAPTVLPSLICDNCAARVFPETSVSPAGQVRYRYGDDGPVTAVDVSLEISRIQVNFLPSSASLPWEAGTEEEDSNEGFPAGHRSSSGTGHPIPGGMSVLGDGLELTYRRSARRMGGLEASMGAVSLLDLSPRTAFSRIVSPAPVPVSGKTRPSQVVISYHFSPKTEAQVQVMVNHLETIAVPSAIHKLRVLAKPTPPPPTPMYGWKPGDERDPSPVGLPHSSGLGTPGEGVVTEGNVKDYQAATGGMWAAAEEECMHDLAALQLAQEGGEEGAPKTPLTLKATLLNPVLILPQDDKDPDCNALFLQGLIIANYVRSPRNDTAFQLNSDSARGAAAEARDTSLEIIRLESQVGRMFGGSGRGPGASTPGGLGGGAGAIDPVTLSLHYSEVERPLHPMVKDLKCQVEEVVCQLTYQDMSLFNAVLSGWSSGLLVQTVDETAETVTGDTPGGGGGGGAAAAADAAVTPLAAAATLAFERTRSSKNGHEDVDALRLGIGMPPQHASDSANAAAARAGAAAAALMGASALDLEDEEEEDEGEEGGEEIQDDRFYEVVFETPQLGIILLRQDGVAVVEEVSSYNGVGGRAAGPFPGDELTEVAGMPTSCLSYDGVVDRIRASPRPISLRFRRALFKSWWGREYTLDLSSWDGHRLDGVLLVGGGAGDQAVVGSAGGFRPRKRRLKGVPTLRPRAGALVVSVAGIPVSHLTVSAVTSLLNDLASEPSRRSPHARGVPGGGERRKVAGGWTESVLANRSSTTRGSSAAAAGRGGEPQGQQRPRRQQHQLLPRDGSSRSRRGRGDVIRLVLREVEVQAWPPNWRHEVQCPGVRVTVIDDLEGRDMPLLRAEVGSLDMTHESGPGMARYSTGDKRASLGKSILGTTAGGTSAAGGSTAGGVDTALVVVPVSRTAAACDAQVDYYNATGGRWEPLLERVVAQGDRAIVTRRRAAAAQDPNTVTGPVGGVQGEAGEGEGETSSVVRLSCFEEDVKINVTHAALDVVLRALRDYKSLSGASSSGIGAGTGDSRSRVDGSGGNTKGASLSLSPTSRSDGGAGGVVETTLAAAAQLPPQPQRYSPFLLQNRTGLKLEFWAHQDKVDSVSRFGKRGTVVGGMSDQPFSTSSSTEGQLQQPGRRKRHHASWLLSVRLVTAHSPSDGLQTSSEDPPGVSGVGGNDDEGQRFLNLPLTEAGRSFLQCMLVMEGVPGRKAAGDRGQSPRRLSRCDAIWEVCLENGRHTVTLRSALEVVNKCGSWLEVRCSTDSFAAGRGEGDKAKEEVVGAVAPGGRLPLPLRWSRAEDIRLRPWPRGQGGHGGRSSSPSNSNVPKKVVEVHDLGGGSGNQGELSYEYSDCSVLVPAARAGEGELGATTAVIPWVACNPSQPSTNSPSDGDSTASRKPLFLFLEGLDANDPEGGHGAAIPGGGSRRNASSDPWSRARRRSRDGGGRSSSRVVANSTLHGRQRQRSDAAAGPAAAFPTPMAHSPRSTGHPMAALSLRPLEVVVYASLSFRNLLPVGVGWRVAGARGDAGARLAEGWLAPGDGVHVLEANAMAMAPSLSFKVAGFDWTPPRQVAVAELMRPTRAGSTDSDGGSGGGSSSSSRGREGGVSTTNEHVPGISLQSVPCRNMSNQILYLSVEAASVRMNSVLVTVFAGFWVRNLSGLPLTLGEPVSRGLSPLELHEERLADSAARDKTRRYSPSPPRQSSWDVHLSAVQSDQHGMTEEVFELRLASRGGEGMDSYDTRWITAQGNPRSPCVQVRLPSDLWRWDGEWTIDVSGAVAPNAPGTDGGGWESCPRKLKGASYSNSSFSSSRAFTLSDPVWRRRWVRRRVPYRPTPQPPSAEGNEETLVSPSAIAGKAVGEGTSIIYQPSAGVVNKIGVPPAETHRAVGGGGGRASRAGAGLCVRVDDSAWSRPLNIAVQGAGGPFQVPGGRWPGLKRPAHPVSNAAELRKSIEQRGRLSPTANSGVSRGKRGVWGEGDVGVYELAYDVRVAPAPWNRTRVITVAARYTVMNKCDCVLVVRQYGSNVTMELGPGESRPLHWADGSLEATLSVSVISRGAAAAAAAGGSPEMASTAAAAAALMDWSGPVGIGNIGTFPICIRPKPGGAALPVDSHVETPPMSRGSSPSSRAGSSGRSTPVSSPHRGEVEPMPVVGANRVLGVEVNIGRHSDGGGDGPERPVDGKDGPSGGGQGFRSSAVQVIFQEEAWGTGDRFPTYRLENHTNSRIFYGQASVPGPGDALPPGRSCLFGWDHPCPVEERVQGVLNLSLVLAAEPLSSPEGKRQAKTLNIRKLGERTSLVTPRGRVEVVVEPDGPSKLVRMYKSKAFSIMSPPTRTRARPPQPVQSNVERARTSPRAHSSAGGNSGADIIGPPRPLRRSVDLRGKKQTTNVEAEASASLKRASSSPTPSAGVDGIAAPGVLGIAAPRRQTRRNPRHRSLPPRGASKNASAGGGDGASPSPVQAGGDSASSEEISLRELHVFCRAVRVSVVDGDRGEVVLGSLEGMSMNVAATEAEVEVKFKLGSLQIDNHLPGTSFPVLLQPVRPGYQGGDNKCVRFTLVAAPRVKNVTYIKLASLNVEEFDLRLDEGMVRWAQGLADRVMWTLVADRRADEMDKWPLPQEAFCSSQAGHPGRGKNSGDNADGSSVGGGQGSTGMVASRGGGEGAFASRYVYLEVFQVSSVKVRLSLQRAKDSFDNVYVGVKPGQMLLDLMMRMDSAHIKLGSLIVHNATTTRSRLTLTAREHYERELKQQAFLMLGSLEAFGNPVGLVRGMGQGMQDFVKEPVLGLLKSVEDLAPEELMHGMARGAGSLLNHSVGGVANSVSLITGTVSQNLTTLAMDKEYKLKRARRKDARGENKDVLDGIGSAGGSLARGLTDGVSGLIKNPLKGAERGGLAGFAKGVGTGMLGLVVKPVVGVTDAATDLLQGVRGTTASIAQIGKPSPSASPYHQTAGAPSAGQGHGGSLGSAGDGGGAIGGGGGGGWDDGVGQVRPRRVLYGSMRTLRPYAIEDARAAALLRTTRYKEEEYAAHLEINQAAGAGADSKPTSAVVILTQSKVLLLRLPGGEVVLEQRLAGIQAVEIKAEGVLLHLHPPSMPKAPRQGTSGYLGLPPPPSEEDDGPGGRRNRGRVQARGIPCREEASKRRLYELLDAAVKNAARGL